MSKTTPTTTAKAPKAKKKLAPTTPAIVLSHEVATPTMGPAPTHNPLPEAPVAPRPESPAEIKTMTLIFKRLPNRKNSNIILFGFTDGRRGQVQFQKTAFPEVIPDTIEMTGEFAERKVATPRTAMTAEERKAARAARPKPTLVERAAKAEARAAALRAKVQQEAAGTQVEAAAL